MSRGPRRQGGRFQGYGRGHYQQEGSFSCSEQFEGPSSHHYQHTYRGRPSPGYGEPLHNVSSQDQRRVSPPRAQQVGSGSARGGHSEGCSSPQRGNYRGRVSSQTADKQSRGSPQRSHYLGHEAAQRGQGSSKKGQQKGFDAASRGRSEYYSASERSQEGQFQTQQDYFGGRSLTPKGPHKGQLHNRGQAEDQGQRKTAKDSVARHETGQKKKNPREKQKKSTEQYLDFPFLVDELTIQFIKESKVLFIMRGQSGSGKSTIVDRIKSTYKRAVVCCADKLFEKNGEYKFDKRKLDEAHRNCKSEAKMHCSNGRCVVVIDNTNIEHWEMAPYLDIAKDHGYMVVTVSPRTPWQCDPIALAAYSIHGLQAEFLRKKIQSFQPDSPLYWGWFLNRKGSHHIEEKAEQYFRLCLENNSDLKRALRIKDVQQTSMSRLYQRNENLLHCTTFYSGGGNGKPGATDYMQQVQKYKGRCYQLRVIGFVVTPKSVGARVALSKKQLKLWREDGIEPPPQGATGRSYGGQGHSSVERSFANMSLGMSAGPASAYSAHKGSDSSDTEDEYSMAPQFQPTSGLGSRAHLTLGTTPGSKPVQTGHDLEQAIRNEHWDTQSKSHKVEGATIRHYREDMCVVYLNQPLTVCAIFTAQYR